jgi:hypothetical protein
MYNEIDTYCDPIASHKSLGPLSMNENSMIVSLLPKNFCTEFSLKDRIILLASSGYFLRNINNNIKKLDELFPLIIRII